MVCINCGSKIGFVYSIRWCFQVYDDDDDDNNPW